MSTNLNTRVTKVDKTLAFEILINSTASTIHRTLIMTLDFSGSMRGDPIKYGRMAVASALRKAVLEFDDVVLLAYNHDVEKIVVNRSNIGVVAYRVERWKSSGATDFIRVFQAITKILRQRQVTYKNKVDLRVSFFTDGMHYKGIYGNASTPRSEHDKLYATDIQAMYDSLNQFKRDMKDIAIKNAGGNTTVVARGYSSDNDIIILNSISSAGLTSGNYKYANTPQEITDILTNDDAVSGHNIHANMRIVTPTGTVTHSINITEIAPCDSGQSIDHTHTGVIFIPLTDIGDIADANAFLDINNSNIAVPIEVRDLIPISDYVSLASQYCGCEILAVTKEVVAMNACGTVVKASKDRIRNLDQYLNVVWGLIQKTKIRTLRKRLAEDFMCMKTQIHDMNYRVAHLSRNSVSNVRLSQMLSAGHSAQYINKAGFRNRLNKRVDKNIIKFQDDDAAIETAIKLFDTDAVSHYEATLGDDTPSCYITLSPWYELTKCGDMLCMTGMMARSEVAISDPSKIKFSNVYPMANCMSFCTFQDELMVKLDKNLKTEDQLHGGFAFNFQNPSGVLTALSNQHVNFVFPMYICADHWSVARHLITRNLGWMATLDWAGYDFQQIKTIPFVLLNNAISSMVVNGTTEAGIQKFFNIARVAKQLIVDYNMKTVDEDFKNWLKSPLYRTGNVINDINIFLVKILFLSDRPNLDRSFWLTVVEEMSRRALLRKIRRNGGCVYDTTSLASQHDFKKYVAPVKKTAINSNRFRISMMNLLNKSSVAYDEGISDNVADDGVPSDTPVFDSSDCRTTPGMMHPVHSNEKSIQGGLQFMMIIKTIYEFMNHTEIDMNDLYNKLDANYGIITPDHITAFSDLDIRTVNHTHHSIGDIFTVPDKQMYAMFLQNNKHPQHSKRRDASSDGSYINPFSYDSHVLIQQLVDSAVNTERSRQMTISQSSTNSGYGDVFKQTDDIITAAGVILNKCRNIGDHSFIHLYSQLQDGVYMPLFIEKTRLLIDGEYLGARLYRDINQPIRWPASWKNMHRIMRSYREIELRSNSMYSMSKNDWLLIFRWKQIAGGNTVLRRAGEFPLNTNHK
jgi:hypothetical protein